MSVFLFHRKLFGNFMIHSRRVELIAVHEHHRKAGLHIQLREFVVLRNLVFDHREERGERILAILGNDAAFDGLGNRFGAGADVKLGVDVAEVETDGVRADEELVRDCFVGIPVDQCLEYLKLSFRKGG